MINFPPLGLYLPPSQPLFGCTATTFLTHMLGPKTAQTILHISSCTCPYNLTKGAFEITSVPDYFLVAQGVLYTPQSRFGLGVQALTNPTI